MEGTTTVQVNLSIQTNDLERRVSLYAITGMTSQDFRLSANKLALTSMHHPKVTEQNDACCC